MIVSTKTMVIENAALSDYRSHGFLYLRNVIPQSLLKEAQNLIEPWVEFHIALWQREGLIDRDFREFDFGHRLLEAWRAAGKPFFRRRPNRFLINPQMYAFFRQPVLLDIAEQFIGTPELSVHGIFNARSQMPDATFTDSVWHQDSQYWDLDYGVAETDTERRTHVMTMWMPLQYVDESSGALCVMSKKDTGDRLFPVHDYDFKKTGYLGLPPDDILAYPHICEPMEPGDALVFNQRTPHGVQPNLANHVRWSIDVRYEATSTATKIGSAYGFVAQSRQNPQTETPLAVWLRKQQKD